MDYTYNIPLDITDRYQPLINIVIKNFKPFRYSVTLFILDGDCISNVMTWENYHATDHMDLFFKDKPAQKREKSKFGKIKSINEIIKLCNYIDKNHSKLISQYFKG